MGWRWPASPIVSETPLLLASTPVGVTRWLRGTRGCRARRQQALPPDLPFLRESHVETPWTHRVCRHCVSKVYSRVQPAEVRSLNDVIERLDMGSESQRETVAFCAALNVVIGA